jgi:hypothetical protein
MIDDGIIVMNLPPGSANQPTCARKNTFVDRFKLQPSLIAHVARLEPLRACKVSNRTQT